MCKNKDGKLAVIKHVGNGKVKLLSQCGKSAYEPSYIEFRDGWKIVRDRIDIKDYGIITNYNETLADSNEAIELAHAWGQMQQSFKAAQHWINLRHATPIFHMQTKPDKRIILQEDAKANP